LLKAFVREILRNQPANIYEFGAEYFKQQLDAKSQTQHYGSGGGGSTDIENQLRAVFIEADVDHSGYLSTKEFKQLLKHADLGLSNAQIRLLMSEADENEDDQIDYNEFMIAVVQLIRSFAAKKEAEVEVASRVNEAREKAEFRIAHGITKEEYESIIAEAFREADVDGSGYLSRNELRSVLKAADIGLTRKEVNLLLASVDLDHDQKISFDEFRPLFHEVMVEVMSNVFLKNSKSQSDVEVYLQDCCRAADPSDSGHLTVKQMRRVLQHADLGLSKLQVITILGEAQSDGVSNINYYTFLPLAAAMIYSYHDTQFMDQKLNDVDEYGAASHDELTQELTNVFISADADGNGYLDRLEMFTVMTNAGLSLNQKELNTLMVAVDEDEDGKVSYTEFVKFAPRIMEFIQQDARVRNSYNDSRH